MARLQCHMLQILVMAHTDTNRQRILRAFEPADCHLKKSDIIRITGINYYHNTEKHVGDTLSRMVGSGLLDRVSKGVYKLGKGQRRANAEEPNPDQTTLFQ